MAKGQQEQGTPLRTYKNDSWRDKAPTNLEEERWWKPQHHLNVLEVVSVPWRDGGRGQQPSRTEWGQSEAGTIEDMDRWALTIDVHDGHTHDAGDDDQGEAGCIIVH